jgi:lipopolysaccharide transport system permease protein
LWFFIQPLLTTITYVIIFGRVAKLSTDGLPMLLFYLSGITVWNYFAETLSRTSTVFRDNANLFGKVYFPRLTMPVSIVISNLLRFSIQFFLFLCIWVYYLVNTDAVHPNFYLLLTPLLILIMGLLSLGLGMIVSSLTTKYKDLSFLISFSIQLLMFATPVIYPLSSVPDNYKGYLAANPISAVIETFRYGFLGSGSFSWLNLGYSFGFSLVILFVGVIVFNRVEKKFTDII